MDEPCDLRAFGAWLKKRRLARDHHVRYFETWVGRFLRFRAARGRETWSWVPRLQVPRISSCYSFKDT